MSQVTKKFSLCQEFDTVNMLRYKTYYGHTEQHFESFWKMNLIKQKNGLFRLGFNCVNPQEFQWRYVARLKSQLSNTDMGEIVAANQCFGPKHQGKRNEYSTTFRVDQMMNDDLSQGTIIRIDVFVEVIKMWVKPAREEQGAVQKKEEEVKEKPKAPKINEEQIIISTDSLCCPVCYEIFPNAPLTVECGHSFCKNCVRRLTPRFDPYAPTIQNCPMCRKEVHFSKAVPNYGIKNILDSLDEIAKDEEESGQIIMNTVNTSNERYREKAMELERTLYTTQKDLSKKANFYKNLSIFLFGFICLGLLYFCYGALRTTDSAHSSEVWSYAEQQASQAIGLILKKLGLDRALLT